MVLTLGYVVIVLAMFVGLRRDGVDKLAILDREDNFGIRGENYCQRQIVGEPIEVGRKYLKISFVCRDGSKSVNTVAFEVLRMNNFDSLLKLFEDMFGLERPDFWKIYKCKINNGDFENFERELKVLDTIECHER